MAAPQSLPDDNLIMPSKHDARVAEETGRKLASHYKEQETVTVRILENDDQQSETIELPSSVVRMLINLLKQMAKGNAVTLMPIHAELTTQQAADLLNVSRPFLVKLLENKEIPYHKIGTHRRVYAEDIFKYKRTIEQKRSQVLEELVALDQEMGFE